MKISDILYITNDYLGFQLNETDAHDVLLHFEFVNGDFYKIVLLNTKYAYLATLKHPYPHPEAPKQKIRKLISGMWLKSSKKVVTDGGFKRDTKYLSGWHLFADFDECKKYAQRFKNNNLAIITVKAQGIRKKEHSRANVYLADEIYIPSDNDIKLYRIFK